MIPQVSSNATSLTTKERHYAQLAAKLGTLANSFETTKQHLNLAAEQAFYMRKLGIAQASTYVHSSSFRLYRLAETQMD